MHSSIVNATASYLDDIGSFCRSPDARVAGHIVVTPFSAMQDAPSGSQALTCTAEQLYLNMQASGAAAWVTFCDHYNISAGAFFRLRGNYPPHSAEYSMAFFDAGASAEYPIREGQDGRTYCSAARVAHETRAPSLSCASGGAVVPIVDTLAAQHSVHVECDSCGIFLLAALQCRGDEDASDRVSTGSCILPRAFCHARLLL